MTGSDTLRCALVGLSGIASAPAEASLAGGRNLLPYSHAAALAIIPDATLVAACDIVPRLTDGFVAQWGETWPNLRTYHDVSEMLHNEAIDVLAVVTPDDRHAEIVIAATERGIPAIMCEKPLATTLLDADRMIDAVERRGTILSVEHTRRWDPFFHQAKALIDAGRIGTVLTVTGTLHGERAMLYRNGTHILDLMGYYAGSPPARVFARLEPGYDAFTSYRGDGGHDPASEPGASAYIEYEHGVRGFYNGTKGQINHIEWEVIGTGGRIRISNTVSELWTLDIDTGEVVLRPFPLHVAMTAPMVKAYEELFEVLRHGGTTRSSARDARQVVSVIDAILRSNQAGGVLTDVR